MSAVAEWKLNITWRRDLNLGQMLHASLECRIEAAHLIKPRARREILKRGVTFCGVARSNKRVVVRSRVSRLVVAATSADVMSFIKLGCQKMASVSSLSAPHAIQ